MTTLAIICIATPLALLAAYIAILSHFGPEYFDGDDWDVHPPC